MRPLAELPGAAWAPLTKFRRPEVAPDVVVDPDVLSALRRAVDATPLTLITAQAGAGKTTLSTAFVAGAADLPSAWIALDEGDDTLPSLFHLLGVALESVVPGGCPSFTELLRTGLPAAADPRRAVGVLVNDVLAADPPAFLVVLDDLHVIRDSAAIEALDYLAANAPPQLRLLATSRVDPPMALSRLRARGRLAELRGDDLRFTIDQAEELFNRRLGLRLTRAEIDRVLVAAAGWVTGVRLLGRSLERGTVLPSAPDLDLAGEPAALYEYLADEILVEEAEDVRQFLLDTSVLGVLTPSACRGVGRRPDAGALLADLHRRHHFLVVAVDQAVDVYRYHDLFAGFLRRRLASQGPARVAELHRRAASVVEEPAPRIEHLLAAGEEDEAAGLIEEMGRAAFPQYLVLQRVAAWVERLDDGVSSGRPWLGLLAGVAAAGRGDMAVAARWLEPVLEPMAAAGDFVGEWMATRYLHLTTNDHHRFVPRLSRLEASPRFAELSAAARVDHYVGSTYGAMFATRWDDAAVRLAAAIDLTMASDEPAAVEVLAQHVSPLVAVAEGALSRIEAYLEWTEGRFTDGTPLVELGMHHQRAITSFLRGRFDEALTAAHAGRALLERLGGLPFLRTTLDWVTAWTCFARGDLGAADELLGERQRGAPATDLDRSLNVLQIPLWARVLRAQGRQSEVARLKDIGVWDPHGLSSPLHLELARMSVGAQAAWAAGDLRSTASILRSALEIEDQVRLVPFVGSPRLDLAMVLAEAGSSDEALRELALVLGVVEQRGAVGLVAQAGWAVVPLLQLAVERGVRVTAAAAALSALGERRSPQPVVVPGSPEVLSSREVEVLRLVAQGASNREIAETLVVSLNTVKTHVSHVITKLGVRSRAGAAARARTEHLI